MIGKCGPNPVERIGITAALRKANKYGHFPCCSVPVASGNSYEICDAPLERPIALFYDLDAWEGALIACRDGFGPGCMHALAIKSNPIVPLLKKAVELGYGLECASIGEVVHAQSCGCPPEKIVFDSPCKSRADLAYSLNNGFHINIDNFDELQRVVEIRQSLPEGVSASSVGFRINPMVGAGEISALSVSVADSKFGVCIAREEELLAAYAQHQWLNCVHVHVGSGNMGTHMLVAGIKKAVDFAKKVNEHVGNRQVKVLDIGGGLAVDYESEALPDHVGYAADLRREIPGLLRRADGTKDGDIEPIFDQVITEFGQSLNAKSGWIASRIEYVKGTADDAAQIAVIHFGADLCPRQCYTKDHQRRIQFFDGASFDPLTEARTPRPEDEGLPQGNDVLTHVAGPLCFQGDFVAKSINPPGLRVDDFAVMREAGSNCLSLFSRHCSRFAPTVLGYRLQGPPEQGDQAVELIVLKPAESFKSLSGFWGG